MKVIYDFGSNNGDDLPYYLKKADKVVAVEANPALAALIVQRFAAEIQAGQLVVENCVLCEEGAPPVVPFYVHKTSHVLSQFPKPDTHHLDEFEVSMLPSRSPTQLIATHGPAHYIKIDVEHYDEVILKELFLNGVRPAYISAESHSIEVLGWLTSLGGYKSFKLVNGATVDRDYSNHPIKTNRDGVETYSFPHHCAGPFGDDIRGPWMTANNFFKVLALEKLGWKDIHATSVSSPDRDFMSHLELIERKGRFAFLKRFIPAAMLPALQRLRARF